MIVRPINKPAGIVSIYMSAGVLSFRYARMLTAVKKREILAVSRAF